MIGQMISAFGADDVAGNRPKFRKLRFQMIADTISGNCMAEYLRTRGMLANKYISNYDPVESDFGAAVLSTTGYITLRPVKKHVWEVELTQLGKQAAGEKYAHTLAADCDEWQIEFVTSKYDHLDVTGIVEDGVHAKVEASVTFVITPVGMAARKVASAVVFDIDKRKFGEHFAHGALTGRIEELLGDDLAYAAPDKDAYVKQATFTFEKYDDGWKATGTLK